jgi:DNA mismatch endonuclease (patch repair protein)
MDKVTAEVRSQIMSRVGQRDTDIELSLRAALWKAGVRYRKNVRIHGTPDLVLKRGRVLIFVDSCFWHGCRFHCRRPKSNTSFWLAKLARNRQRDRQVTRHHRRRGAVVLRFWEHQIKGNLNGCVSRVLAAVSVVDGPPTP